MSDDDRPPAYNSRTVVSSAAEAAARAAQWSREYQATHEKRGPEAEAEAIGPTDHVLGE